MYYKYVCTVFLVSYIVVCIIKVCMSVCFFVFIYDIRCQ